MAFSFGTFDKVSNMLAVSLVDHDKTSIGRGKQIGVVALIDLSTLKGALALSQVKTKAMVNGNEHFARFGWQVALVDIGNNGSSSLFVTEPRRKLSDLHGEAGCIWEWKSYVAMCVARNVALRLDRNICVGAQDYLVQSRLQVLPVA
jgi:hypothetical protein